MNAYILLCMNFSKRLLATRKSKKLTQAQLSELTFISAIQIRRYEAGTTQPTLDALKRLAVALSVSIDYLVFDSDERNPSADLKMEFEAISNFTDDEKRTAKALLKGLILKHEAERWPSTESVS